MTQFKECIGVLPFSKWLKITTNCYHTLGVVGVLNLAPHYTTNVLLF